MTHLNSAVDDHERAMAERDEDRGSQILYVFAVALSVFVTGVVTGYGLALLVLA